MTVSENTKAAEKRVIHKNCGIPKERVEFSENVGPDIIRILLEENEHIAVKTMDVMENLNHEFLYFKNSTVHGTEVVFEVSEDLQE